MGTDWLQQAVRNNADWCGIVARSHGRSSYWTGRAWVCAEAMPPLYPNLVTLDGNPEVPHEVDSLLATLSAGWSIKDSFACLDLSGHGFHPLLDGSWFVREASPWPAVDEVVRAVRTAEELSSWIEHWGETPPGRPVFTAGLLEEDAVAFLYLERGERMTAGLVANLSDQVVGLSNVFGDPRDIVACIRHVAELHRSRALVGYGDERQVRGLTRYGFRSIGSLRVWATVSTDTK